MARSIQQIVEHYLGGSHHIEQKIQNMYYCPMCNHKNPRLSVNYQKNAFRCWKCDWSGKSVVKILYDLQASYEDIVDAKTILGESFKKKKPTSKEEFTSTVEKNILGISAPKRTNFIDTSTWEPLTKGGIHLSFAKNYLYERGLSDFDIVYYDIHYNSESGRLVFPSKDFSGNYNYYIERSIGKVGYYMIPKGFKKSEVVFNEYYVDFKQSIILTEGVFDAYNIGFNAIPLLGTTVYKKIMTYISGFGTPLVIFYLDEDAFSKMMQTVTFLTKQGIPCSFIKTKGDAGETDRGTIKTQLQNTKQISKLELVKYNLYA